MVFYLPQGTDQEHIDLILSHGGQVSNIVECFTYQLSMLPVKSGGAASSGFEDGFSKKQPNPKMYYPGNIYSFQWIVENIKSSRIVSLDRYLLLTIPYPSQLGSNASIKKQSGLSGQRTRFTMRELIKIFQVTEQFPSKKNKNQVYWQRFIKQGYFPGRSVNSVNAQWQRFCHYDTVEQALEKALQLGMPYSTAFNTLPPSVDCSILTMKSETLLASKINGNTSNTNTEPQGAVNIKSEGQTLIKNFQSHNVHFQHFMKQKGVSPLKKEVGSCLRNGVKQEQPSSNTTFLAAQRREQRDFKDTTPVRKNKKFYKRLKQEVANSPLSQPSMSQKQQSYQAKQNGQGTTAILQQFTTQIVEKNNVAQSRRASADSTRNMEPPSLHHLIDIPTRAAIDIENKKDARNQQQATEFDFEQAKQQAQGLIARESSDDIIKVKQEMRDEDVDDEPQQAQINPVLKPAENPELPLLDKQKVQADEGTTTITSKPKALTHKPFKTTKEDNHKTKKSVKQQIQLQLQKEEETKAKLIKQKEDEAAAKQAAVNCEDQQKQPCSDDEKMDKKQDEDHDMNTDDHQVISKKNNNSISTISQANKALSQKRALKLQQKVDQKSKKLAQSYSSNVLKQQQHEKKLLLEQAASQKAEKQKVAQANNAVACHGLNELPKECIYCLAKRLYINTNLQLKSKESISSRFSRLDTLTDRNKRSNSLTVSFNKENSHRRVYEEDEEVCDNADVDVLVDKVAQQQQAPQVLQQVQKDQIMRSKIQPTPQTTSSSANQIATDTTATNQQKSLSNLQGDEEIVEPASDRQQSTNKETNGAGLYNLQQENESGYSAQKVDMNANSNANNLNLLNVDAKQLENSLNTKMLGLNDQIIQEDQVLSHNRSPIYFWNGQETIQNSNFESPQKIDKSFQNNNLMSSAHNLLPSQQTIQQQRPGSSGFREYNFDQNHHTFGQQNNQHHHLKQLQEAASRFLPLTKGDRQSEPISPALADKQTNSFNNVVNASNNASAGNDNRNMSAYQKTVGPLNGLYQSQHQYLPSASVASEIKIPQPPNQQQQQQQQSFQQFAQQNQQYPAAGLINQYNPHSFQSHHQQHQPQQQQQPPQQYQGMYSSPQLPQQNHHYAPQQPQQRSGLDYLSAAVAQQQTTTYDPLDNIFALHQPAAAVFQPNDNQFSQQQAVGNNNNYFDFSNVLHPLPPPQPPAPPLTTAAIQEQHHHRSNGQLSHHNRLSQSENDRYLL